jgi:hypothetical protein
MNVEQGCSRIYLHDFNKLEGARLLGFLNIQRRRGHFPELLASMLLPCGFVLADHPGVIAQWLESFCLYRASAL